MKLLLLTVALVAAGVSAKKGANTNRLSGVSAPFRMVEPDNMEVLNIVEGTVEVVKGSVDAVKEKNAAVQKHEHHHDHHHHHHHHHDEDEDEDDDSDDEDDDDFKRVSKKNKQKFISKIANWWSGDNKKSSSTKSHKSNKADEKIKGSNSSKKNHGSKKEKGLTTFSRPSTQLGASAWTVYEHSSFPKYSIRTKTESKLCDPDVKQLDPSFDVLNGGPGCSSLTGLFMELGPCSVSEGGNETVYNPHSWNSESNIVFLDQPTDVGFSYSESGEGVGTTTDAAKDVFAFLQLFLAANPKYAKSDFHVTGAIPAIAARILEGNSDAEDDSEILKINLASVAIGNGLTDPAVQYEYYPEFACGNNYGPVLEESECEGMRSRYPFCKNLIDACYKYEGAFTCVPSAIYCNNAMIAPFQKTGLNIYDIRKKCDPDNSLCYSILTDIDTFLNREDIQLELGVERAYQSCNMNVNLKFMMAGDWMRPYVNLVPGILDEGVKVLVYTGDADYICNWMGNRAWTLELEWTGKDEFNSAPELSWVSKTTGKKAGEFRTYEGLTFLRIYEAGHMVPYDQPEHSNEFINMWIAPKEFNRLKKTSHKL
ncbi:hypothetical protein HDU76_000874 [Blyttiomyces sp. JEL0837]|nr:hypothetical protein HDU76_000874 [Blyttiomyces sp. JEL0837]